MNRYRVIRAYHWGYKVEVKRWWFPFFWFECWSVGDEGNRHSSVERAKKFIEEHKIKPKVFYEA